MKHITDLEELEGKTIKKVSNVFGVFGIAFTDDSFCFIDGEWDFGDEYVEFSLAKNFDRTDLFDLDLITYEEFQELMRQKEKRKEDYQRRQYEELKKKFGETA